MFCFDFVQPIIGDSVIFGTKLFTFSNEKGETISYNPDLSNEKSWEKHFKNIQKQIKQKFGMKMGELKKTNITYNPYNDVNSFNAAKHIGTNILSSTNISQFWNLLISRKNQSCNFRIGDIGGKKATIICVESIQKNISGKMLFSKEDEEEYDWDEIFQKQFIPFIKQVTGGKSGAPEEDEEHDDDDEDVDYDELPFKIYKIECDNALSVLKECNLLNYHEMKEKYDIEDEVDDGDVLEEFFDEDDENDDLYFFIENKACFVIYHGKKVFYWKPDNLKDVDDIDWDKEFLSMKKDICDYFGLINNDKLKMVNGEDKEVKIEQGGDIEEMWSNAWDDDDETYLKILVNGDPLVEFVIDCTNISNASRPMFRRKIGLNTTKNAQDVFLQFAKSFENCLGAGDECSNWTNKYKLIDGCYREGDTIENAQAFFKFYLSCRRKKINPIHICLETKVRFC